MGVAQSLYNAVRRRGYPGWDVSHSNHHLLEILSFFLYPGYIGIAFLSVSGYNNF